MQNYTPIRIHSHYSCGVGLSKPKQILKRLTNLGIDAVGITDINSVSGTIDYMNTLDKKVKPIIGCEINIVDNYDRTILTPNFSLLLLSKSIDGWKSLVKNISNSHINYWNENPHIRLEDLITKDLICVTGWLGSTLSKCILSNNIFDSWLSTSFESSKSLVNPDWTTCSFNHIAKLKQLFGEENLYIGVQLVDYCCVSSAKLMADGARYIARKTGTKSVAITDSYYCEQSDSDDQKVLIVNTLKTDLKNIYKKPVRGEQSHFGRFFSSNNYHIPSYEEMIIFGHTQEELENTNEINSKCNVYNLNSQPILPKFPCPNNYSSKEYMDILCKKGWDRLNLPKDNIYLDRYEMESNVLNEAGLSDYFLIVDDIIKFAISDGQLTGAGRGSAAGSLILYLLGVTHADPIKYGLMFERFYNSGRNTPGNISLPDVDMDFERFGRSRVIEYVRNKYGHDKVSQMITFQRMQGRGALKDVVRAHAALDNETINKITKNIPNEAEISDHLQELKEAGEDVGIIEWSLDNNPKHFEDWAYYDDNGKIQGPLSKIFEQSIRMEGTKRGISKHASGIVISQNTISDLCPMIYDSSSKEMIAAMEMNSLEKLGFVKFDFLGVSLLDKIKGALEYVNY